jgi:signal transduction histidine kinase
MNNGLNQTRPVPSYAAHSVSIVDATTHDQKEYDSLYQNPFVGIFRCHLADGSIFFINQRGLDLLGMKKNPHKPLSLDDIFGKDATFHHRSTASKQDYSNADTLELLYVANGVKRWLSISYQILSEYNMLEGILTDITEKKTLELKLQSMREEMDTFIYHASHELKSPLTTILGAANLLKIDTPTEKDLHKYCYFIEDQALRLNSLFQELMHVYTNNHDTMLKEPIDFQLLLTELMPELSAYYPDVEVNLTILPTSVFFSDPIRLKLILRNLLSNAFKFHKPASTQKWIQVNIETTAQEARIAVKDNGIGMNKKTLNDIFNIFYRGSEISKKGFGVGLYLVKSLAEKLGGTIEVYAQPDQGSVFTLRIPDGRVG